MKKACEQQGLIEKQASLRLVYELGNRFDTRLNNKLISF